MTTSQNGWSASPTLKLRKLTVSGVDFAPGIRDDDDVYYVFDYLATQYAKRVEPLKNPGCWGFSYRPDKNQTSDLSNHASGTAIDFDAPEHPNGVPTSTTFTTKQISTIHEILAELHGAIRWGGDYTHTVDAMHFEINVTPARLKEIVIEMKSATKPKIDDKVRVTVVMANIKDNPVMPLSYVEEDVKTVFALALKHTNPVIGLTEIGANYWPTVKKLAKQNNLIAYHYGENVIAFPKTMKVTTHLHQLLSKGIASVSPNRELQIVNFSYPVSGSKPFKVGVDVTHLVSESYKSKVDHKTDRVKLFNQEVAGIKARILKQHKTKSVVIMGDMNRLTEVKFHDGQITLFPVTGIDMKKMIQASIIPQNGVKVSIIKHDNIGLSKLHTDHPVRWATFELSR